MKVECIECTERAEALEIVKRKYPWCGCLAFRGTCFYAFESEADFKKWEAQQ